MEFAEADQFAVNELQVILVAAEVVGAPGVPALTVTTKLLAALDPQPLFAVTVILPLTAEAPAVTVIEFDVPPAVCDQPEGNTHVYDVAPETADTE